MGEPAPVRISTGAEDWPAILALLHSAFAGMEGRIDPPSSLQNWTVESCAKSAAAGFVALIDGAQGPDACAFAAPEGDALYLSKIAARHRRQGAARALIAAIAAEGRRQGAAALTLQTRIELVENHAAFAALGFEKIAETAHPGYDRPTSITMRRML